MCDAGRDLGADVLDGVTSLVAMSLVLQDEGSGGEPRFGMLETIREYAMEQFGARGEAPVLRDRQLDYSMAFAVTASTGL